jgi:hypothetical protein
MAWALRASSYNDSGGGWSTGGNTSQTLATGVATQVGDRIIVGVIQQGSGGTAPTFSVSDNQNSGNYTEDRTQSWAYPGASTTRQSAFSKTVTTAGATTVTIAITGGGNGGANVAVFTGLQTSDPGGDVAAAATGSGTAASSGSSAATGAASELVVGFCHDLGEGTTLTAGNIGGSAATLTGKHDVDGGNWEGLMEHGDSGASGATPSATVTKGASTAWGMLEVVYKLSGVAPAQDTPELYGRPYGQHGSLQLEQLIAI